MKKKSFLAVLCSAALLLQLAPLYWQMMYCQMLQQMKL